jgi:hypothetical protein
LIHGSRNLLIALYLFPPLFLRALYSGLAVIAQGNVARGVLFPSAEFAVGKLAERCERLKLFEAPVAAGVVGRGKHAHHPLRFPPEEGETLFHEDEERREVLPLAGEVFEQ